MDISITNFVQFITFDSGMLYQNWFQFDHPIIGKSIVDNVEMFHTPFFIECISPIHRSNQNQHGTVVLDISNKYIGLQWMSM